jgi:hypothetical protein
MSYLYEWAGIWEKTVRVPLERGFQESVVRTQIGGTLTEDSGATATMAILDREKGSGNLVHFEIRQSEM